MKGANIVLYFAANLAPRAATFVLLLVLTRVLSLNDYGLFTLVITTGEILDMAIGGWVRLFVLSTESGRRPSSPRVGRALVLSVAACTVSLLGAILLDVVQPDLAARFTVAVMIYVVCFAVLRLGLTLLQARQRHTLYAAAEVMRAGLMLVLAVGAERVFSPGFLPPAVGVSAAALAAGLLAAAATVPALPRPAFTRQGYRSALSFGYPIVMAALLGHVMAWVDRFILNSALGPASVGLYAAAFALARQPVELFAGSLNTYLYPTLVRSYVNDGRDAAARVMGGNFLALVLLCGAVTVGIAILAQPFAGLVLPEAYRADAVRVMPWVALATLCNNLKSFCFDNVFYIVRRNWQQLATTVLPAVISVAGGLAFIPGGGPHAAAVVVAASAAAALAGSVLFSHRLLPMALPPRALTSLAAAMALAAAAAIAARVLTRGEAPLVTLLAASGAFVAVYLIVLSLAGFSLRRILDRPWEIWTSAGPAAVRAATVPGSS